MCDLRQYPEIALPQCSLTQQTLNIKQIWQTKGNIELFCQQENMLNPQIDQQQCIDGYIKGASDRLTAGCNIELPANDSICSEAVDPSFQKYCQLAVQQQNRAMRDKLYDKACSRCQ